MEEQLAELAAQVAAIESKGNLTNTMFAELYYYLTIPLMIIIHAGFLAYEMGASRAKNALSSGVKNILAFAFVIPAFYFFGWWVYWGFPTGFSFAAGPNGISGRAVSSAQPRDDEKEGPALFLSPAPDWTRSIEVHKSGTDCTLAKMRKEYNPCTVQRIPYE